MVGRRVAIGLCAATLGLMASGVTVSHATKTVVSDKGTFTGVLSPNSTGFSLKSTKCSLTSDGETKPYTCRISGTISSSFAATLTLTSSDGMTRLTGQGKPNSGGTGFVFSGKATERDKPDPGKPAPKPYSATWTGTATNPDAKGNTTGTFTVSESPTAP